MKSLALCISVASLLGLVACASTDLASSAPPATSAVERAREGHRLAEANQVDDALRAYAEALTLDPRQPEALRDRALLQHAAGQDAEALRDVDAAVALRPDDVRVLGARCVIRVGAERSDAGLADCTRALALSGSGPNALTALGQAQLLLDRPADARVSFDGALALAPNHMRALYGRGLARQATGDAAGADDVAQAVKRLPGAGREFRVAGGTAGSDTIVSGGR